MAYRILLVEDECLLCELVCMMLHRQGYETDTVFTGQAAIDYLCERPADLILLDYSLPDLTGIEVLHQLRETPTTSEIPVILTTGRKDVLGQMELADWDLVDVLPKPFTPVTLVRKVQSVLPGG
jgi:DNA-binding response OmpR family regulator